MARINDNILRAGQSRIGRFGTRVMAVGISILILAGLAWLALEVLEGQGFSG